ncbi:MAG: hypothetical protein ACTSYD_10750 [Candidatus Heimdallarchaeaceae archaeon]
MIIKYQREELKDMAIQVDSPFKIIRTLIKKFLSEMRLLRSSAEEQVKARAEEIKSNSLLPGKSQYSIADVDSIIRTFKDTYVRLLRDVHLMIVTEGTTKIRQGIEQGFIAGNLITQEMMDELEHYRKEAQKVPELEEKLKQYELKIDEYQDQIGELKAENISLQNEVKELQSIIQSKDQALQEMAQRVPTYELDESVIKERDQLIAEKDKLIHQLSLEKTNLQSEYNRLKIERDAYAKRIEDMEARLRTLQSEAVTKEEKLFEDVQKQLEKSRTTIFNLRNQLAEKEDTILNQKVDLQQRASQIESLKKQLEEAQTQIQSLIEENSQLKSQLSMVSAKLEEQEAASSRATQLTAIEEQLKAQIKEKETFIVDLQAQLETANKQVEDLSTKLHQRDSDLERLAENMIELQQDLSSKEQELHRVQTQLDELMLQLAEKEAEIREIQELQTRETKEKQSLAKELEMKNSEIAELERKLNETLEDLKATKHTIEVMEKQGTMSSEEKYQYELKLQKLSKKADNLRSMLKSLVAFLNTDPKYRILYLLNDFNRPLNIEELTGILKLPKEIIMKYLYELDYFGYIKRNIESGKMLIESTTPLIGPAIEEKIGDKEESD